MIFIKEYPTQHRAKELFDYDNGRLLWRNRPRSDFSTSQGHGSFNALCAGKVASAQKRSGYWVVKMNKKYYSVHRLIYIWNFGDVSTNEEIDHIDNDILNNDISNLRKTNRLGNTKNRAAQCNSKTGIKGVSFDKSRNKWQAQVVCNGKKESVRFERIEDAIDFATEARNRLHGEFSKHM